MRCIFLLGRSDVDGNEVRRKGTVQIVRLRTLCDDSVTGLPSVVSFLGHDEQFAPERLG